MADRPTDLHDVAGGTGQRSNGLGLEEWRRNLADGEWHRVGGVTTVDVVGSIAAVDGSEANWTIDPIGSNPVTAVLGFLGSPLVALLDVTGTGPGVYVATEDGDAPNGYTLALATDVAEGESILRRHNSGPGWASAVYLIFADSSGALSVSLDADPDGIRAIHVSDQDVVNDIIVIRGQSRWRWNKVELDIDGARRYYMLLAGGDAIMGGEVSLRLGWNAGGEEEPDFAIVTPNKLGQPTGEAWADATDYVPGDIRFHDGGLKSYIVKPVDDDHPDGGAHTSSADTEPGVGADWETVWDPNVGSTDHGNDLPAEYISQMPFTGNVTVGSRGGGRSYVESLEIDHKPENAWQATMVERIDEDGKWMYRLRDPLGPQTLYAPADGDTVELPNGPQRAWVDSSDGAATIKFPDPSLNPSVVIEVSNYVGGNALTLAPFDGESILGTGAVPFTYIATYAEAAGDWYQTGYRSWD